MIYRRFGRTGIAMPVLSCGGMRYQHQWDDVPSAEIPQANKENLERTIHRALELGINLLLGGHYATETFGVKALAHALAAKFGLPWEFLDQPSGL
jgi:predicted aldo/keto reductase-like oxidoreductase